MHFCGNGIYMAPFGDTAVEFHSDGTINQAGFILKVKTTACECGASELVIPCNGETIKRTFLDNNDQYFFCNAECKFTLRMADECLNETRFLYIRQNQFFFSDVFIHANNKKVFMFEKYLTLYDPSVNYSIEYTVVEPDDIIDVLVSYFSLFISGVFNLTRHIVNLDENNPYFFVDLTGIEPLNFFEINGDGKGLEIFVVTDCEFGLTNLDLYTINETNYIDR
uniref:CUB domain-containing protein n=1 Tax=Panagrolaimus sp. JU765 TaxID=591449 RepID=A0AC34RLL6_9BILA